jgi:hypothetical protein
MDRLLADGSDCPAGIRAGPSHHPTGGQDERISAPWCGREDCVVDLTARRRDLQTPITRQPADSGPSLPNGAVGRWTVVRLVQRLYAGLSGPASTRRPYRPAASDGATDAELRHLAGPDGRLEAADVRWDVIGASCGGSRHRI